MFIFKMFVDSAKELKKPKSIIMAALLLALHTVLACFVSLQVTSTLRISISFITNCVTGFLFGPVMGLVCGGLGDIIQFIIKPTGPYFPGWTVNAALAGFIYGCFFYGRSPKSMPVFRVKNQEKDAEGNTVKAKRKLNIWDFVSLAIAIAQIAVILTMNIVKYKGTAYSGLKLLGGAVSGKPGTSLIIDTILLLVGAVFIIVAFVFKLYPISIIVSVITSFITWLAIYTDKKTTSTALGFMIVLVLVLLYTACHLYYLLKNYSIDVKFFLLTVVCLTLDTVIVNVLLGTYWCTVMYGKGFDIYFTSRLIKNLIQLPVNIALVYYVLGFMRNIKKRFE